MSNLITEADQAAAAGEIARVVELLEQAGSAQPDEPRLW
jgi:hypothetical protein